MWRKKSISYHRISALFFAFCSAGTAAVVFGVYCMHNICRIDLYLYTIKSSVVCNSPPFYYFFYFFLHSTGCLTSGHKQARARRGGGESGERLGWKMGTCWRKGSEKEASFFRCCFSQIRKAQTKLFFCTLRSYVFVFVFQHAKWFMRCPKNKSKN